MKRPTHRYPASHTGALQAFMELEGKPPARSTILASVAALTFVRESFMAKRAYATPKESAELTALARECDTITDRLLAIVAKVDLDVRIGRMTGGR